MRSIDIASRAALVEPLAGTIARWAMDHPRPKARLSSIERLPASRQMHVVRCVVKWVFEGSGASGGPIGFARVTETGIWESSEDPVLAGLAHAAIGGVIAGDEPTSALVVVEEPADLGLLRASAFLWTCFGWGWVMGNADGSRVAAVNHDGMVWSPSGAMPSFL
ncbi:MAG: hypothetical protein EA378_05185 [Phycisphaerales bacterium]|nr:MAG: hypothetical protein EA378_05185 [Phycisphaerales bacterium]